MRSTKPVTSLSKHLTSTSQLAALHPGLFFPFNDAICSWTGVCKTRVTRVTTHMQRGWIFCHGISRCVYSLWCRLCLSHSRTFSEIHAAPNVFRRVIHESSRSSSGFTLSLVLGAVLLHGRIGQLWPGLPSELDPDDLRHLAGALEILWNPCTSIS